MSCSDWGVAILGLQSTRIPGSALVRGPRAQRAGGALRAPQPPTPGGRFAPPVQFKGLAREKFKEGGEDEEDHEDRSDEGRGRGDLRSGGLRSVI